MIRRVMIIAGEASGDLHGAGVVRELLRRVPGIDVFGMGGEKMRHEGADILVHINDMAFMGFVEVVRNLPTVVRVNKQLKAVLRDRRPDVVLLIDYPDFNLRFARAVRNAGIPVFYYISPQVWAWRGNRVKTMRRLVNKMFVIFPFEEEIYHRAGIPVEFVGHPLVEHLGVSCTRKEFLQRQGMEAGRKVLGLFPGSRVQEIEHIFPVMLEAARTLVRSTRVQVAVGVAPNLGAAALRGYIPADLPVTLVEHATHDLMAYADAAVVTSGTATLETAWFGTPFLVVYRTSPLTFAIGRALVRVPAIGLVNIVAGAKIVPELIQHELTAARVAEIAGHLLGDAGAAASMRKDLSIIRERLGAPGASQRVVDSILACGEAA
jgi:lipid-A-disaccharide synthase